MEKLYKRLFTKKDVLDNFGYNLDTMANRGGFPNEEASSDAWCDEAALTIHSLIVKNRGILYAKELYKCVEEKDQLGNYTHPELREQLAWAQLYQMLHIIENGNIDIQAENKENIKRYS
ncbi:MAG: hypothetical protein K2N34_06395, partial [Lachnospiraceae bacterium]|nr:hypothetical protein [Lachnospiraceae bacterium]